MADDNEARQLMKIALVGVRPADQVTIKGYFRVLLRLDAELQWVPATEKGIDLFIINEEFRQASSITKLLEINKGVPVLFVTRSDSDEGGLSQNLLTLPLKQINLLNDWLVKNVIALSNSGLKISNTAESAPIATDTTTEDDGDSEALVPLIRRIQSREAGTFELIEGARVIAIIDNTRQLIWVQNSINRITTKLQLRPYSGQLLNPTDAKDATNWLWQLACHNPDSLIPLIDNNKNYRLRFWAKPTTSHRRELLNVMTAIEKEALSPLEIANRVGVSILTAKKVLAALLFSANLTTESYVTIVSTANTRQAAMSPPPSPKPEMVSQSTAASQPPTAEPAIAQPASEEKLGFLSRLRRKLGL